MVEQFLDEVDDGIVRERSSRIVQIEGPSTKGRH